MGARDGEGDLRARLLVQVAEAARAGVDLVQIRERDLAAGALADLATQAVRATAGTLTEVLMNDRLDVAMAAGAAGVHLRAESFDALRVRRVVAPDFLVGRSVHSAREAKEAAERGGLDYLVLGPVFASLSKASGHEPLGLGELERAADAVRLPVLAIGGITIETMPVVARTGVAGLAGIGLFLEGANRARANLEGVRGGIADVVQAARLAFQAPA